jgi:hypothetical protein
MLEEYGCNGCCYVFWDLRHDTHGAWWLMMEVNMNILTKRSQWTLYNTQSHKQKTQCYICTTMCIFRCVTFEKPLPKTCYMSKSNSSPLFFCKTLNLKVQKLKNQLIL